MQAKGSNENSDIIGERNRKNFSLWMYSKGTSHFHISSVGKAKVGPEIFDVAEGRGVHKVMKTSHLQTLP